MGLTRAFRVRNEVGGKRVLCDGLMEIQADFMNEIIAQAEHSSLQVQIAEIRVRLDSLTHLNETYRREYIESMNKSAESRIKMHDKMDGIMDRFRNWESKFQWWLIVILGGMVTQMIFVYFRLN